LADASGRRINRRYLVLVSVGRIRPDVVAFGILGFLMREAGFPVAPLILGVVLGPILDANFRRSLSLSQGDPMDFVSRPISAILAGLVLVVVIVGLAPVRRALGRLFRRGQEKANA